MNFCYIACGIPPTLENAGISGITKGIRPSNIAWCSAGWCDRKSSELGSRDRGPSDVDTRNDGNASGDGNSLST